VVQVGDTSITKATFDDWMSAMAPEHFVPDPPRYTRCIARMKAIAPESIEAGLKEECRQQYQALRQRVLALLISSHWAIDEAADRGLKVSEQALAARAQLATAALRRALEASQPKISSAAITAYYQRNIHRYERPEKRSFDLFEHLRSKAAARRALQAAERGRRDVTLMIHESLDRPVVPDPVPWKRSIQAAIFAGKPKVLVGPVRLFHEWAFFEVTSVRPRVVKALADVQDVIRRQLESDQRRQTLTRFIAAWRKKWIAQTDCSPGYVVQKCRQYRGPKAAEDPLAFN